MRHRIIILAALLTIVGVAFGQKRRRVATQQIAARTAQQVRQPQQQPQVQPQASEDEEWKLLYDRVFPCRASKHYMVVNGRYIGLVTAEGEEIITPGTYDVVYDINLPDFVLILKGGLFGAYNIQTNKEAIPCQYDENGVFVTQLYDYDETTKTYSKETVRDICTVVKNGKGGIYDVKLQREIMPCQYSYINWKELLMQDEPTLNKIKTDEENNKLLPIELQTETLKPEETGRRGALRNCCGVFNNGKEGVYDIKREQEIIPCQYDGINVSGKIDEFFIVFNYPSAKNVAEGMTGMPFEGVYDTRLNKQITPLKYGLIALHELKSKDYCRVEGNRDPDVLSGEEGIGLIDRQGNELLTPAYTYLQKMDRFNEASDIFVVGKGGKFGGNWGGDYSQQTSEHYALYDAGKKSFLTSFDYKMINSTSTDRMVMGISVAGENLASFCTNDDKWGFMDVTGKVVIPAEYEKVTEFENGVAQVMKDGVTSLLTNPLKGTILKVAGGSELGKDVDSNIPQTGRAEENLFAYVFANERYAHLKGADYALNDGKVFAEYCKKTLGVPEKQVHYYEDATFGNLSSAMNQIKDIAEVYEGEAKIIFYFAGLGATDHQTKERYLLPSDATLETVSSTGYSVLELQKALSGMNTIYTLAILDAPFSNVDRNGNMLGSGRGVRIAPKQIPVQGHAIICTGSMGDETAYASKDYGHGLFTFGILQQLQSTKGDSTLKELIDNATTWTKREAMNEFEQTQTPQQTVSMDMEEKWKNLKL